MMPSWMHELKKEGNSEEFSQLVHDYYKLATMRVMQEMREKYKIPPEDIPTLTAAIMARMLNDACYSVGAFMKNGYTIDHIYSKEQLLTLVKVLNGEPISQFDRTDIDTDIQSGLNKFRCFILKNASNFYTQGTS